MNFKAPLLGKVISVSTPTIYVTGCVTTDVHCVASARVDRDICSFIYEEITAAVTRVYRTRYSIRAVVSGYEL